MLCEQNETRAGNTTNPQEASELLAIKVTL